jgi:hypothetical protein
MPNLPQGIHPFVTQDPWENAHQNFKHRFKPGASYELTIDNTRTDITDYVRTTQNMQWLIRDAIEKRNPMRAMGSNWSFSQVAMCDGGMVQTKNLNLIFQLGNSSLAPTYRINGGKAEDLLLVQSGATISYLNDTLEIRSNPKRSIKVSGGSNGQTLAGAVSTNTHGAALFYGALPEMVRGIHLVTGPDSHFWLEPESRPVVSDEFIDNLGTKILRSDALFYAALVSFGSFGIIHGMLIETEPLFLLQEHRLDNVPYTPQLIAALAKSDVASLRAAIPGLPESKPGHEFYHFEINVNLFNFEPGSAEKGVYVRSFYKVPPPPGYVPEHGQLPDDKGYGPELTGLVSRLLDALGPGLDVHLIPALVKQLFEAGQRLPTPGPQSIGEIFRYTRFRGQIGSAAFAVDGKDFDRTLQVILAVNKQLPLAGGVAMRFVKGTKATLGFTHFEHTVVFEMDGIDSEITRSFFQNVWENMESQKIPYTLHWGKLNFILNEKRVFDMYGKDRVDAWKKARETLLKPEVRDVFTNAFMKQCGLDKPAGATSPIT